MTYEWFGRAFIHEMQILDRFDAGGDRKVFYFDGIMLENIARTVQEEEGEIIGLERLSHVRMPVKILLETSLTGFPEVGNELMNNKDRGIMKFKYPIKGFRVKETIWRREYANKRRIALRPIGRDTI